MFTFKRMAWWSFESAQVRIVRLYLRTQLSKFYYIGTTRKLFLIGKAYSIGAAVHNKKH